MIMLAFYVEKDTLEIKKKEEKGIIFLLY